MEIEVKKEENRLHRKRGGEVCTEKENSSRPGASSLFIKESGKRGIQRGTCGRNKEKKGKGSEEKNLYGKTPTSGFKKPSLKQFSSVKKRIGGEKTQLRLPEGHSLILSKEAARAWT